MTGKLEVIKEFATRGLIVLAAMIPVASFADCNPQFTQFGPNGFGYQYNRYAWSVAVFNDELYIGIQNEKTGAQIWRTDGVGRERVLNGGLTSKNNIGPRSMAVCLGKLWAGTDNSRDGAQLWNTSDGQNWTTVLADGGGITPTVRSIRGLSCFTIGSVEYLYLGMQDLYTGGKVRRTADGVNFETIVNAGFGNRQNTAIHVFQEFNGAIYAGTQNDTTGLEVWRTVNGTSWENVVGTQAQTPGGFGHENSGSTLDLEVFNGHLYLGDINAFNGFGVWATPDGLAWQQIGTDGFGVPGNDYAWQFAVYEGALWLGTLNNHAFFDPGTLGGGLWRSFDPFTAWEEMVGSRQASYMGWGFDDHMNMGIRTIIEYHGKLYFGTAQDPRPWVEREGFELWVWPGESCPAQ